MGIFDFLGKTKKPAKHIPPAKVTMYAREATPEDIRKQLYDEVAEIKKLQKDAIPSKRGLLPHEILMLYYAPKYSVNQTKFPQFWYYKYAVDNPAALLRKLEKEKFIRNSTAKESLDKLTVSELKGILSENNVKATGEKADLIKSISDFIDDKIVEKSILDRSYALTELGEKELKDNEYVPYMHNCKYSVSIWDINKLMDGYPTNLWRDRVWGELNRLYLEGIKQTAHGNWSFCDSIRHQQIDFLMEENKLSDALELTAEVAYNEIAHEAVSRFKLELELRENRISTEPMPTFAEIVQPKLDFSLSKAKTIAAKNGGSEAALTPRMLNACSSLGLNSHILSTKDFIGMVESRLSGKDEEFVIICNKMQRYIVKGG